MSRSGPQKEKPKTITIHKVKRTRRFIFIAYDKGDEVLTLRSNDNPLTAFLNALDELSPLVAQVCHFPPDYCEIDLRVMEVQLGTQGGSRTVSVIAQKSLDDASKAFKIVTPPRLLEHPTQEGSYTPPLTQADKELVEEIIVQAKAYLAGDRAQGQLPLEGDEDDDGEGDEAGGELPLAPDNGGTGKAARKRL